MSDVRCPQCGRRYEVDDEQVLETRTVGVTDDWETWQTLICDDCDEEFMYRTE